MQNGWICCLHIAAWNLFLFEFVVKLSLMWFAVHQTISKPNGKSLSIKQACECVQNTVRILKWKLKQWEKHISTWSMCKHHFEFNFGFCVIIAIHLKQQFTKRKVIWEMCVYSSVVLNVPILFIRSKSMCDAILCRHATH